MYRKKSGTILVPDTSLQSDLAGLIPIKIDRVHTHAHSSTTTAYDIFNFSYNMPG